MKLSEESGLALGRGLDLCPDLDLLVSSSFFLDVWLRWGRFSFFPIIEKYSYTLSFTVLVISCMINPNFQTSGPRAEQAPSRGDQHVEVCQVIFVERSSNNTFCT